VSFVDLVRAQRITDAFRVQITGEAKKNKNKSDGESGKKRKGELPISGVHFTTDFHPFEGGLVVAGMLSKERGINGKTVAKSGRAEEQTL
jgi:hypothetical protein